MNTTITTTTTALHNNVALIVSTRPATVKIHCTRASTSLVVLADELEEMADADKKVRGYNSGRNNREELDQ